MIAAWMAYATLVIALACVGAHAAERALRLIGRAGRWTWGTALLAAFLLPLTTIRRAPDPVRFSRRVASELPGGDPLVVPRHDGTTDPFLLKTVVLAPESRLASLDQKLRVVWIASTLMGCLVLGVSGIAVARRRPRWTRTTVDGVPVLVSHSTGPALVGVLTPEIVVPAWLLDLPVQQRTLAIAHEREHARARDPVLLLTGTAALVAMPWNVALWYALGRLRLAVEADCDQRVLRAHPDVHAYGSLLVDVNEKTLTATLPLVALAESASHLARRLALMTARAPNLVRLRLGVAALVSGLCIVLACETPQPSMAHDTSEVSKVPGASDGNRFDVALGAPAPPLLGTTLDGTRSKTLADYKGKVVLLNVWSTWCYPCRAVMPDLEKLHREFGPQGLAVVAVSAEAPGTVARLRDSTQAMGLTFEVLHDATGATYRAYQVKGVPETFIIARDGTLRKKVVGSLGWEREADANRTLIRELLRTPEPSGLGVAPAQAARAVVHLTDVGLAGTQSAGDSLASPILIYATGAARLGIADGELQRLQDTLRLFRFPAISVDVTDADVHIELTGPGQLSLGGAVSGAPATHLSGTGRHIVLLKGGVGIASPEGARSLNSLRQGR
jgi:cytochrome c biogenesis protein CcmG/thiol:disulfide interchange protein DsbE